MSEIRIPKHKYFDTKAVYNEQVAANTVANSDICFIGETREIIVNGRSFGYLGQSEIDPELLEGFIPLSRDFSDDFNNDFAR